MATGYTAPIKEGIGFTDFVLMCARAFGACIALRDEPLNSYIPEFTPDTYHKTALQQAKEELADARRMKLKDASIEAKESYDTEIARIQEVIKEKEDLREKYLAMLAKVDAWVPPSSEHQNLKDFMRNQLTDSLSFDCDLSYYEKAIKELKLLTAKEWKTRQIKTAADSVAYHKKHWLEEQVRVKNRNKWVNQLKKSLRLKNNLTK